jgi:hypothetical protein
MLHKNYYASIYRLPYFLYRLRLIFFLLAGETSGVPRRKDDAPPFFRVVGRRLMAVAAVGSDC